jgi:hypothetical protein
LRLNNLENDTYLHFENDNEQNVQTLVIRVKDEQFAEEVQVNLFKLQIKKATTTLDFEEIKIFCTNKSTNMKTVEFI